MGYYNCNKPFEILLAKYGVKHKVATPYYPQTYRQVELANQEIKNILMKVVNTSKRDWSVKLLLFTMGLRNNLQDHSWNVSLSPNLWQSVPSPR